MNDPAIQLIEDSITGLLAKPFSHEEMLAALQDIARRMPASAAPHLAMAVAFGLGHRDLAALEQHVADAGALLPGSPDEDCMSALAEALRVEAQLVRQMRGRRPGAAPSPSEQARWAQTAATGQAALDRVRIAAGQAAVPFLTTVGAALGSLALAVEAGSLPFTSGADLLRRQFDAAGPLSELAGFFLTFVQQKSGDLAGAIGTGEALVKRNPACLVARTTLGSLYYFAGRFDDARTCYQDALQLAPNNAQVHLACAKVDWRLGRLDEADEALRQAQSLDVTGRLAPQMGLLAGSLSLVRRYKITPVKRPSG